MKDKLPKMRESLSITLTKADGDSASAVLDGLKITGKLRIEVHGPDGKLKDFREINNLVVNTGLTHVRGLMQGAAPTAMTFMGVGSGTTSPSATDTALETEITTGLSGTRVSITRTTSGSYATTYTAAWTAGQATNGAITEAGIFNASSLPPPSGTMLSRSTFTAIPKAAGDSLTINWTITVSA